MPRIYNYHNDIDDLGADFLACAPAMIIKNVDPSGTIYVTGETLSQVDIAGGTLVTQGGSGAFPIEPGETFTLPIDTAQRVWLYTDVVHGTTSGYYAIVLYYSE